MSDVLNNKELITLRNKFLCCVPVNEIRLQQYLSSITWDDQAFLLNQTIKNDLLKNFPIKSSYQKAFLKSVIEILERNCIEIHDILYDSYCDILSCDESDKYYYKHYLVEDKVVSLKENKSFISEGTTGLCSWQASLALSQWCLNNNKKLQNKTILELGSGVGLVGLTIIQHCHPKELNFSDCHPQVLSVLTENVSSNIKSVVKNYSAIKDSSKFDSFAGGNTVKKTFGFGEDSSGFVSCGKPIKTGDRSGAIKLDSNLECCDNKLDCDSDVLLSTVVNNTKVNVLNLPWEHVEDIKFCENLFPDLILAADVVYDNSVFKSLCGAIKYFLGRKSGVEVIFACTERNPDTLQEFLNLLEDNHFKITKIDTPQPENYFWSMVVPIRFYLVTSN